MKVSVITVSYNARATLPDALMSIQNQSYDNIEHILIDGASSDGTMEFVVNQSGKIAKFISEPDNGIYDAMNKGIMAASGDIVGFLNADDMYYDQNCLSIVINEFRTKNVDSVFADLVYVLSKNLNKVVRYYCSAGFSKHKFSRGLMPAHPTFFAKRKCYERYGCFKTDYKIAADYELLARFLYKYNITYSYIPKVLVKMRKGGASTKNLKSNWILNKEIIRACSENGIKTNLLKIYLKYFTKFFQLINKPC